MSAVDTMLESIIFSRFSKSKGQTKLMLLRLEKLDLYQWVCCPCLCSGMMRKPAESAVNATWGRDTIMRQWAGMGDRNLEFYFN